MVNVIIPTYNALNTLPDALDSLVAQTKKMFIVTIVQDCDGLDYTELIEEYRRRGLKIRHIYTPENLGPGGARQYGMDIDSMCDYFMFLDSDDMLYPRAIDALYREAKLHDADIICSDFAIETSYAPISYFHAGEGPVTWTHGKIYKAQYLRDNNIRFIDGLRLNEDSHFNLVAVNCAKKKYNLNELTYLWRDNKASLTRKDEDRLDYFSRSWWQYIQSQVQGLTDISRIKGELDPQMTAATLNNMYVQIMEGIYYKLDTSKVKELCLKLKDNELLLKVLDEKLFWSTINTLVKGSLMKEDVLIFFKMRFCDWLNEFILEKESMNEDSSC